MDRKAATGVWSRGGNLPSSVGRVGQGGRVGQVGQVGRVGRVGQIGQGGQVGQIGQVGRVGQWDCRVNILQFFPAKFPFSAKTPPGLQSDSVFIDACQLGEAFRIHDAALVDFQIDGDRCAGMGVGVYELPEFIIGVEG